MEENIDTTPEDSTKIKQHLSTVTPFSKYLAMFLFLVFLFFLGVQYGKHLNTVDYVITPPLETRNDTENLKVKKPVNKMDKVVSVQTTGKYNQVIYTDEYGHEISLDKALLYDRNFEEKGLALDHYRIFSNAYFSPKETYVLYGVDEYEQEKYYKVYSVEKQEHLDVLTGNKIEITPNEEYVISCVYGRPFTTDVPSAKIYRLKDLSVVYDPSLYEMDGVFGKGLSDEYKLRSCGYIDYNGKNAAGFTFDNEVDVVHVYYNFDTEQVTVEK